MTDTARVVACRAALGAALLLLAGRLAAQGRTPDPAEDLLAGTLGLLAGPLALAERAAHLGRPWAALVWSGALAVVGVLFAAVQAGFAARVLTRGGVVEAHAAAHADVWLAALHPTTLPVVLARALPFALLPVLAGRGGRRGLLLAVVLGGFALPPLALGRAGEHEVLLPGDPPAWALPTGPRAEWEEPVELAWLDPRSRWLALDGQAVRVQPLVLRAAAFDALALALAAILPDLLVRWRPAAAGRRTRALPLARGVPTVAVAALAALLGARDRAPPAFLVPALLDLVHDDERQAQARRLLDRLGPRDVAAVQPLVAALRDAEPDRRRVALRLLARIGPPGTLAAVPALAPAIERCSWTGDLPALLDVLEPLGPATVSLGRELYRARTRAAPADEQRIEALLVLVGHPLTDPPETRQTLLALLDDPDWEIQLWALLRLDHGEGFEPADAAALHRLAFRHPEAVAALADMGSPGVTYLRYLLHVPTLSPDDPALELLERLLPDDVLEAFELAVRHPTPGVRRKAAEQLDAARPSGWFARAVGLLVSLLDDPAPDVRAAAACSLRSHGWAAVGSLEDEVDRCTPRAAAAAAVLGELGAHGQAAIHVLLRALEGDAAPDLLAASARALGRLAALDDPTLREAVLQALLAARRAPDERVAAAALGSLEPFAVGPDALRVWPTLAAALEDPAPAVRTQAAITITRAAHDAWPLDPHLPRVVEALCDALPAEEAGAALVSVGRRAQVPLPLLSRVVERGGDVTSALRVIEAAKRDDPGAVRTLGLALRTATLEGRLLAIELLEDHPDAAADLVGALADDDPRVREAAARALRRFEPEVLRRVEPALRARLALEGHWEVSGALEAVIRKLERAR
ncbi:MAG: hypothetical protein KF878_34885 [Planctomycetes bacterium]|nr:hypothetical protein [Planctomycetota bacterium]